MADIFEGSEPTFTPIPTDYIRGVDDPANVPISGNILISELYKLFGAAPSGFLINGKIVPSVTSNNLTVAVKGFDGNNPSAANPVYVVINSVVREITSALSVTKNAGTNWCNAGGAELANKEIDYFVYLGYNATDGVVIGFSRIPNANLYSEFSATTTNEKYCAISTITNAAAGDNYVNIGRFAATLSAGAGYTWTVPTFTAINLIQRPIYETRWLDWVPTVTSGGGTPTTVTKSCTYRLTSFNLEYSINLAVVDKGTATGVMTATLPFGPLANGGATGGEIGVSGKIVSMFTYSSTKTAGIYYYDGTTVWVNSYNPIGNGFYRVI